VAPSVYVETTILSYLTARPSGHLVTAAHQKITAEWWRTAPTRYRLVASAVVTREAQAGDPDMAAKRLALLAGIDLLDTPDRARDLARHLLEAGLLPPDAGADALHVAVAAVNRVEYLATWNLRHLAGAVIRRRIENALRARGFEPPEICTPEELLTENQTDENLE
jgi:predicted nucleic acid-binding protein